MASGSPKEWLADETLFSFCSRFHRLSNHRLASETTRRLFGHPQSGSAHDLPSRVDWFAARTDGELGTAESIIRTRTILPYFLPFKDSAVTDMAISRMRGAGIGSLKYQLGLLTSRFRAHHPLKACPKCVAADRDQFGTGLWRLPHQLPGTWICEAHDEPLQISQFKVNGIERFLWHLPNSNPLAKPAKPHDKLTVLGLHNIAEIERCLWASPANLHFDPEQLSHAYFGAIKDRGYATTSGRLRVQKLAEDFASFLAPTRAISALSALPASVAEARVQLGRLLGRPRTGTHPIRHVCLVAFLFGSWESFLAAYAASPNRIVGDPAATDPLGTNELDRSTPFTQKDGACREPDIQHKLRPKRLHAPIRLWIIEALRQGADRKALATTTGFSEQTIARILRAEPGLQARWSGIVEARQRASHRREWDEHRRRNRTCGVKDLRMMEPALFAWLYRHDRAWLTSVGAPARVHCGGNHSSVCWDHRDRVLADAVRRTALEFSKNQKEGRICRRDLIQLLPELAQRIHSLSRLPLTARTLAQAVAPPRISTLNQLGLGLAEPPSSD